MKNDKTYEYRKEIIRPNLKISHLELGKCKYDVLMNELPPFKRDRMYFTTDTNQFFFDYKGKRYQLNMIGGNGGNGEVIDMSKYITKSEFENALKGKQDKLSSGNNIKTINEKSILGSGNITIIGGSGTGETVIGGLTEEQIDKIDSIPTNFDATKLITDNDLSIKLQETLTTAKTYADSWSTSYATNAQGIKADNAIQEIVAGDNISITSKADNKQTISIKFGSLSTDEKNLVDGVASVADVDSQLVILKEKIKELEESHSESNSSIIKVYTNEDCIFNMVPFDVDMSSGSSTFYAHVTGEDDGSMEECGITVSITKFTIDVPKGYSVSVKTNDISGNYTAAVQMNKTEITKGINNYNRYTKTGDAVTGATYQITITKE